MIPMLVSTSQIRLHEVADEKSASVLDAQYQREFYRWNQLWLRSPHCVDLYGFGQELD